MDIKGTNYKINAQKKSSTEIRGTLFLLDESLEFLTTMLCSDTFLVRGSVPDSTREVVVSAAVVVILEIPTLIFALLIRSK